MTSCLPYEISLARLPIFPVDSPLSHLTTTNDPPTNREIGIVHEIVDADKVSIDQIDKMLDDLSEFEKIIKGHRMAFAYRIHLHQQILKPHRSLPSDVLCEIFRHILFDMRVKFGLPTSPHKILGEVCRGWRNVLFSNPRLWTFLPELDLSAPQTRQPTFNSMLRTTLQLSRSAPLNIELRYLEPSQFTSHPALTTLLSASDRYQRLSLSILYSYLPQFASLRGNLGSLRTLNLYVDKIRRTAGPMDLFNNVPNLQNLTVDSPLQRPLCEWLSVPWPQLIRFSGQGIRPTDIVTLLTRATSLEDCTFHCAFPPMALGSLPSVIHHRLVKLRIYSQESTNEEPLSLEVLNRLTLPGLLEITIKDIGLQAAILVNLITRSHCVLSYVDMETSLYGDISSFLNAISAVRTLCITPTKPLMRFLFQNIQPVLPRLRYLMFYSMATIPAQEIAWVPLARASQPSVDPLATFIIVKLNLRRSHYETFFDQLDQWPGLDTWETQFPVYKQWIILIEASPFDEICQDPIQQLILANHLTEMENLRELHPRYLYARDETSVIYIASLSNKDTA